MKLFGIIENTMVFEDQYAMPTIFIDISDEDKETLIDEGAYIFSDWAFVHAIPEALAFTGNGDVFEVMSIRLRSDHKLLTEGDKMVLAFIEKNV